MSNKFDKFRKYSKFESDDKCYEIHWNNPDMPFLTSRSYWWNTSEVNECGNLCFYRDCGEGAKERAEFIFESSDGRCAIRIDLNAKIGYYADWENVTTHHLWITC